MKKFLFLVVLAGLAFGENYSAPELNSLWDSKSQYDRGELTLEYLNSEKARREDDFATNIKRRNYLKDRLIFQYGFGSKYGFQIDASSQVRFGVGQGLAMEYITRWGLSAFLGYGGFLEDVDQGFAGAFEDVNDVPIDVIKPGHSDLRIGLGYYFFPQFALHPGIMVSYGNTMVGHELTPSPIDGTRALIVNKGINVDANITYMDYGWYYLTMNFGFTYTTENNSLDAAGNARTDKDSQLLDDTNMVFGFGGGIAIADLLPDITEKRRRERVKARAQFN